MLKILTGLLVCAAAQAATSSATLTVNATLAAQSSGTAYTATGTAALTGAIAATGTFNATVSLASLSGTTIATPYTITFSGGMLTGTLSIPLTVFEGATSATGSATVTGGTGTYAGDMGSFPSLAGSGGLNAAGNVTVTFSGSGTITNGTATTPPPTITAVLDAASNTANLAQGTIFIVKGSNLCTVTTLTEYNVPRPTVGSDGVTITFTPSAGGTGTNALLWYEDPLSSGVCQLAGILPSAVAAGNYNVTVSIGSSVSSPVSVPVVASKFALFTQDSTGSGLAVAQNVVSATEYDLNRLTTGSVAGTTISPAHPGQYMVAYGTGMGGVTGDDNAASPVYDFTKNGVSVNVIVGGVSIPALFAGLAGYAGEDQINFQLPATVPTGCTVTFQVSVNGSLSPATTIAIAPSTSASACSLPGYTSTQLESLDNGGTISVGGFEIAQISENITGTGAFSITEASGAFTQISGFELASLSAIPGYSLTTVGSCTVIQVTVNSTGQILAGDTVTNLDAGKITLTGPAGSNLSQTALSEIDNTYSLTIGESGITIPGGINGSLVAGTYTLAGAGGTSVGSFNTSITLGTPLTVTGGLPATVTRAQGLTINWTGGNSSDQVAIIGFSGTTSGTGASAVTTAAEFICPTTAGKGTFTVPSSVLNQLPATAASSANGAGFLEVTSGSQPVSFSPSLSTAAGGGTVASLFQALMATAGQVTYQ